MFIHEQDKCFVFRSRSEIHYSVACSVGLNFGIFQYLDDFEFVRDMSFYGQSSLGLWLIVVVEMSCMGIRFVEGS